MSIPVPSLPDSVCVYERYDPETLQPSDPSAYIRLVELGWDESTFEGKSVLDIGGNAGLLSLHAHALGATQQRLVDVQLPLLEFAQSVVDRHDLPIAVERVPFAELRADEHGADVVLCMEVLHWLVVQGISTGEAIDTLASLTGETLFLETPWDVKEPSIARHGEMNDDNYSIESIVRELQKRFMHVEVVRFMTYFGAMRDSKRVLIRADGPRADGDILSLLPDASPLNISLSRGSNSSSMLMSPDGPLVLKTLPTESFLPRLDPAAMSALAEHLTKAEKGVIVAPLAIGDRHVHTARDGSERMLFPFVGDLGDYFPQARPHQAVASPLDVAVTASKALAGLPAHVVDEFRQHSDPLRLRDTADIVGPLRATLESADLIAPLDAARERMERHDTSKEDAVMHNDLQLGNMLIDPDGRDRVLDIDLMRSGPAYADLLICAAYNGATSEQLDAALAELRDAGFRPLAEHDIDFCMATILGWAREISRQEIVLPESQHASLSTGLRSVADLYAPMATSRAA